MVERGNGRGKDIRPWSVGQPAVVVDVKGTGAVSLRHPTYPYREDIALNEHVPTQARAIAVEYLGKVQGKLFEGELAQLGTAILARLGEVDPQPNESGKPAFRWLDVSWGISTAADESEDAAADEADDLPPPADGKGIAIGPEQMLDDASNPDPRGSFWVVRQAGGRLLDATLVLSAGFVTDGFSHNGEQGLRVTMHVDLPSGEERGASVRVVGADVYLAGIDAGSIGVALKDASLPDPWQAFAEAARQLRLDDPAFVGYGYADTRTLRLFIVGSRGGAGAEESARLYSAVVDWSRLDDGTFQARTLGLHERVTHADGRVFPHDPASAQAAKKWHETRPTTPFRREQDLDAPRRPDSRLPEPPVAAPKRSIELEFPLPPAKPRLQVRQSKLEGDGPPGVREVDPTQLPLRTDDLGAAHAYVRGRELFRRMSAYGLRPRQYFKLARLPLVLRPRAPIVPGARDGQTVNAQVRPLGNGMNWDLPFNPAADPRSRIEVRFAAANLSHRRVLPRLDGRKRAQDMGLAADPRWAWHEFGHVLNLAATGALELSFAHSIGDALAAVTGDAESALAHSTAGACRDHWRGATYPWVAIARRHDRKAEHGWSWSSRRFVDEAAELLKPGEHYRAYFAEQLLSSAIFRLYRAIGGDSVDATKRCSAADYVVYLLMRGLANLGGKSPQTATAGDFVNALVLADTGTGYWDVNTPWNGDAGAKSASRVGGCVHKVIRWAFEQQGLRLKASSQASAQHELADVYIADRRRPPPGDGGYWPESLAWDAGRPQPWHAAANSMSIQGNELQVQVRNRGPQHATGIDVFAWCWPAAKPIKVLTSWYSLQAIGSPPTQVDSAGSATFRFSANAPPGEAAGDFFVLAAASCPADRANIDPAAALPCGNLATPLVDLIANDNNLGFAILPLP